MPRLQSVIQFYLRPKVGDSVEHKEIALLTCVLQIFNLCEIFGCDLDRTKSIGLKIDFVRRVNIIVLVSYLLA